MEEQQSNTDGDQFFDALEEFEDYDIKPDKPPTESHDSSDTNSNPSSTITSAVLEGFSHKERRDKILSALQQCERIQESSAPHSEAVDHVSSSFLAFAAGMVIKAIGFQLNLLLNFVSFPIWFSYFFFLFITDPCHTLKHVKDGFYGKFKSLWDVFSESFAPYVFEKLKGQKSLAKLGLRFGWGFVISVYICFVLFGLLVVGFAFGGITIKYLVQEPFQMKESLNFDYTRSCPVALVPIVACPSVYSGVRYQNVAGKSSAGRVLLPNHKLQLAISLMMPESDYNRKLGVFQVRVDFLSENGEVTASSRIPCMLRFKSHLIRYLETFLKSVPLLAGYTSESQVLNVKMRGFTEGYKPTSCIRVILEQRAEYRSGAGIPEIYTATLLLESKLPLLRRILWCWKKTIFVWISLVSFTMELMVLLLCCRPVLIPRARPRNSSTTTTTTNTSNSPQNNITRGSEAGTRVSRAQS